MVEGSQLSSKTKRKKSPQISSPSWDATTAAEKMSVRYVAVQKPPPHDYMSILHDEIMANIPARSQGSMVQEADMVDLYREVVEPYLDFHVDNSNSSVPAIFSCSIPSSTNPLRCSIPSSTNPLRCSIPNNPLRCSIPSYTDPTRAVSNEGQACDHNSGDDHEVVTSVDDISGASDTPGHHTGDGDDLLQFASQLNKCRNSIRRFRARVLPDNKWYWNCVTCCGSMLRFVGLLMQMVQRCIDHKRELDQDTFRELFRSFGNIFNVEMHPASALPPLVIQGQEVTSVPDLSYEKFPDVPNRSVTQQVFTVSVAEVKSDAEDRIRCGYKRQCPTDEIEDDTGQLPSKVCGQHASQLVKELPNTYMPNKNCMLGFIVQATKVRLTWLVMSEEHRKLLESKEERTFEHEAVIHFTRSYDMLDKEDRHHLLYIMVTLSKLTGDIQANDH